MIAEQQDTDKNEEVAQQSLVALPEETDNSGYWKSLKAEQADQLSDADTKVLADLYHNDSLEGKEAAIDAIKPELALLITRQTCLSALLFKAHELSKDMVPKTGTTDYYVPNRAGGHQSIRQSAATIDRVLEDFCSAKDIDHNKLDIKLIQDHPGIKGLDITRPKPFQTPREATTDQRQWDFDT